MPYPDQPRDTPIPPQLDRWNWGAFLLNWIWGIGNSTYIALLMFVPGVNLVMLFVLGAKGSRWAWKNRLWVDEAHFRRTQRNWAIAGIIVAAGFVLLASSFFVGLPWLMKNNEAYRQSMAAVRASERVVAALGEPIDAAWWITGNVGSNGPTGAANFAIPVSGPKGSGTVISQSVKTAGVWSIDLLVVTVDGNPAPIILINERNLRIPGVDGEA